MLNSEHQADGIPRLRTWALGMAFLASATPHRLTTTQMAVFMFAAMAHRSGRPTTFTELRALFEGSPGGSVHTTYGVFFGEARRGPSLGWLKQVQDPLDMRRKFLWLTPKGRAVIDRFFKAVGQLEVVTLEGMENDPSQAAGALEGHRREATMVGMSIGAQKAPPIRIAHG